MSLRPLKLVGLFIVELEADARDACADAGVTERRPLAGDGVCIRDAPAETGREACGDGGNRMHSWRSLTLMRSGMISGQKRGIFLHLLFLWTRPIELVHPLGCIIPIVLLDTVRRVALGGSARILVRSIGP